MILSNVYPSMLRMCPSMRCSIDVPGQGSKMDHPFAIMDLPPCKDLNLTRCLQSGTNEGSEGGREALKN